MSSSATTDYSRLEPPTSKLGKVRNFFETLH